MAANPPRVPLILAEPSDRRQALGARGERLAEALLLERGMTILARRFRSRAGELDLVAIDRDVVVFVEVKTRGGTGWGHPSEAVTRAKRERMARVARLFLARHRLASVRCRFDVVELVHSGGRVEIRHLRDAFRLWPTG